MKHLFLLVLLCYTAISVKADGIEFFKGTWAEALAKSKETGKLIFMDAFTEWCGPCKKMSAQTFTLQDVGAFYNANFINMKIDMEKGEGLKLAGTFSVNSYPTLLYIDGEGKLVSKVIGYMDGPKFINAGKSALKKNDKSDLYAKEYNAGKRDYTTILNYVRALNMAGKSSTKISNEYIKSQKDMSTPENLRFLYEATTEADSRIFDLFIKHKDQLTPLFGTDQLQQKILTAATKTVQKSIEFKTEDLLVAAIESVRGHAPSKLDQFEFESNLAFYTTTENSEGLQKAMKRLPKSIEKNSGSILLLAQNIEEHFAKDAKLLGIAEEYLNQLTTTDKEMQRLFALGKIYALNQKHEKAVKALEGAIQVGKKSNLDTVPIEQFILKMSKS